MFTLGATLWFVQLAAFSEAQTRGRGGCSAAPLAPARPERYLFAQARRLQEGGRGDVGERGMRGGRGTARAAGTNAAAQSQSHPMDTEETHGQLVCPVFGAAVVVTATVAAPCGETTAATHVRRAVTTSRPMR